MTGSQSVDANRPVRPVQPQRKRFQSDTRIRQPLNLDAALQSEHADAQQTDYGHDFDYGGDEGYTGASSAEPSVAAKSEPATAATAPVPTRSRFASVKSSNEIKVSAAAAAALSKGVARDFSKAQPSTAADIAATYTPNLDFDGPQYMFGGDSASQVSTVIKWHFSIQ